MESSLIAPCGMNCAICVGHFGYTLTGRKRENTCLGCRVSKKRCSFLKEHCGLLAKDKVLFCFECDDFPCTHLKKFDERYRKKYSMSMIENLDAIRKSGLECFLNDQTRKYRCPQCGEIICVHTDRCYSCSPH